VPEHTRSAVEVVQVGNVSVIVPGGVASPVSASEIVGPKFVLDLSEIHTPWYSGTNVSDSFVALATELSRRAVVQGDRLAACHVSPQAFIKLGDLGNAINIFSTQEDALAASAPTGILNRTARCPTRGCDTELDCGGSHALEWQCPECRARMRFVTPPLPPTARVRWVEFETYRGESARVTDHIRYSVAECVGRLDLFAAEQLEKAVLCLPEPRRVLLHLARASEVSSGGAEVLNRVASGLERLCVYDPPYPKKLSEELLPRGAVTVEYAGPPAGYNDPVPPITVGVTVQLKPPTTPSAPQPAVSLPRLARRRRLEVEEIGDITVVNFVDKKILDEQNIQMIGDDIFRLVMEDGRRKIVLNFGNVEFLSSAAFGKLITLHRMLQGVRGKLVLCKIAKEIIDNFRITKLDKIFTIAADEQSALQWF
jgi:anti-sigma B factor antagonist